MFMGVPIVMAALMLMAVGLIVVLLKNPLYLAVMIPVWFAVRELVSRDYNAVGVLLLYLRTAGRSVDGRHWGGATVTTHPIRLKHRGRGMVDVG